MAITILLGFNEFSSFLVSTCKRNHTAFAFVWHIDILLSTVPSRSIRVAVKGRISFIVIASWITFHSYSSIIPSLSTDGHSSCFPVSVIMNNIAMNMAVQISLQDNDHFFEYIPRSETAGSYGSSIFLFLLWGTSLLFPIVSRPIYIPVNTVYGFLSLHVLTNVCYHLTYWS